METFEFIEKLIDLKSSTDCELGVVHFLRDYLKTLGLKIQCLKRFKKNTKGLSIEKFYKGF